jgi:hypothetical protein
MERMRISRLVVKCSLCIGVSTGVLSGCHNEEDKEAFSVRLSSKQPTKTPIDHVEDLLSRKLALEEQQAGMLFSVRNTEMAEACAHDLIEMRKKYNSWAEQFDRYCEAYPGVLEECKQSACS